jgi:hypothetical protein
MANANVKLSQSELLLVCDEQFILTKNNIINKVYLLFGMLSDVFSDHTKTFSNIFSEEIQRASPKIYKGENYRGLPYVMLDYPRYFTKDDAFSIRCLFWWGNFFSIMLHVSGKYLKKYSDKIYQNLLRENNQWYVCINADQWEYHFGNDNFVMPSKELLIQLQDKNFLKLAQKISLDKWDDAYDFFVESYKELLVILNAK